jgi:hypothetical protein
METLETSFGESCAEFVLGDSSYLDCNDVEERDFALEKLNARVGSIIEVRKTENHEVRERTTSRTDLKLQDHVPHDKSKETRYRFYWVKGTNK